MRFSKAKSKHNDMDRMRSDLQWCCDRLSHILYIWENPDSLQAGFGPSETMAIIADDLPEIMAAHGLSDCRNLKQPIKL